MDNKQIEQLSDTDLAGLLAGWMGWTVFSDASGRLWYRAPSKPMLCSKWDPCKDRNNTATVEQFMVGKGWLWRQEPHLDPQEGGGYRLYTYEGEFWQESTHTDAGFRMWKGIDQQPRKFCEAAAIVLERHQGKEAHCPSST